MDIHGLLSLWTVFLCVTTAYSVSGFNLTILHTNDVHGRIEEMNKYNGRCLPADADKDKCYGGVARRKTKIDELRAKYPNTILLDAGDQYQGTLLFYVYGGSIMAGFMNILGYNAMALGNHEFDRGTAGVKPLLDTAAFPVLSCNIDTSGFPKLATVQKSVVLDVSGNKVGVIGYTSTYTPLISKPGKLKFYDEVESIQKEVDKLIGQNVNIIIALGHSGYDVDLEIAKRVTGLDVVVGGHTNTFLYTGHAPSTEEPLGLYPTVVKSPEGNDVLVVQDYAYGKYLGFLQVEFDASGNVTEWNGNPILLDHTVAKDSTITALIKPYLPKLEKMEKQVIGKAQVVLQGDMCRVKECNMGNFLLDAIIRQSLRYTDTPEWNHVAVAFIQGGGIRTSIAKGNITAADVLSVIPFGNTVDTVELKGKVLLDMLEHSAGHWKPKGSLFGGFLQMSGVRVVYNMDQEAGSRVVKADVRCADCEVPEFFPLNMRKTYKVMLPSFLYNGGDGYSMIKENAKSHFIGGVASDMVMDYLKLNSPVTRGLDGRITIGRGTGQSICAWKASLGSTTIATFSLLQLFTICLVVLLLTFY